TLDDLILLFGLPSFIKIDVEGSELEVLKGLSTAVNALSFEFTPEMRETGLHCLERLSELGSYFYNFSFGESGSHFLASWQSTQEFKSFISRNEFMGDVYASLAKPAV